MRIAKTKTLISCAVTAQLICVFVFAYAKSRFSHNEAHIVGNHLKVNDLDVMAHSCSSSKISHTPMLFRYIKYGCSFKATLYGEININSTFLAHLSRRLNR